MIEALFAALCVAFAALGIWLAVRFVNRRENSDWASWTITVLFAALVFLVAIAPSVCLLLGYWAFMSWLESFWDGFRR